MSLFDSPFLHSPLPLRCFTCQHTGSPIFGTFTRLYHVCAQHAFALAWKLGAAHEFKSRFTVSQLPLSAELKCSLGSGCKELTSVRVRCDKGVGWLILQHIRKNRVINPSRLGLPAMYRRQVQSILASKVFFRVDSGPGI